MKYIYNISMASLFALGAVSASAGFDGMHVGASLGMVTNTSKQTFYDAKVQAEKMDSSATGAGFGLHFGYGGVCDTLYTGVELRAGYESSNQKTRIDLGGVALKDFTVKNTFNTGIHFKVGHIAFDGAAMAYFGLGFDYRWYTIKAPALFTSSKRTQALFLTPALGIEGHINDKIRGFMEFNYGLGLQSRTFSDTLVAGSGRSFKFKPNALGFRVGINYALSPSCASGSAASAASGTFAGPFVGANIGVSHNAGKHEYTKVTGQEVLNPGATGFQGGLFAGVNREMGNLFWGVEAGTSFDTSSQSWTIDMPAGALQSYSLKRTWGAGVAVRFGRLIFDNNAVVYVRLGGDWQWYKMKAPAYFVGHKTFNNVLITPGIGMERRVTDNIHARFEFTHGFCLSTKKFTSTANTAHYVKFKTNTSAFKLSVIYKF